MTQRAEHVEAFPAPPGLEPQATREPSSAGTEVERVSEAAPSANGHHANRQAVMYCPYCAEETLFPQEHGWECRSCLRAFSVRFLGLVPAGPRGQVRS